MAHAAGAEVAAGLTRALNAAAVSGPAQGCTPAWNHPHISRGPLVGCCAHCLPLLHALLGQALPPSSALGGSRSCRGPAGASRLHVLSFPDIVAPLGPQLGLHAVLRLSLALELRLAQLEEHEEERAVDSRLRHAGALQHCLSG